MAPLGFHVNFRLVDSRVIAPDTARQRRLARSVLTVARPFDLLGFRCADTHGHLELLGDEAAAREATRRVLIGLQRSLDLPVPFARPWFEPIHDQRHLRNTLHYLLRQADHHGFGHDPFHEASSLPDLLGLRPLGVWTAALVRARLPRVTRGMLLEHLGAADLDDRPLAPDGLADAAAAAIAAPDLRGRSRAAHTARVAAVEVGCRLVPADQVAELLSCTGRSIRRLARQEADPALVRAIEGQLRLRAGRAQPPAFVAEPAVAYRPLATSLRAPRRVCRSP